MRMKETKSIEIMAKMYEEEASNEKSVNGSRSFGAGGAEVLVLVQEKMKVLALPRLLNRTVSNLFFLSFFLTVELCMYENGQAIS